MWLCYQLRQFWWECKGTSYADRLLLSNWHSIILSAVKIVIFWPKHGARRADGKGIALLIGILFMSAWDFGNKWHSVFTGTFYGNKVNQQAKESALTMMKRLDRIKLFWLLFTQYENTCELSFICRRSPGRHSKNTSNIASKWPHDIQQAWLSRWSQ